jgi:CheY-like chemotaxis protein
MKPINILVVDDDNLCLLIANKLLQVHLPQDLNFELELCSDPTRGLKIATTYLNEKKSSKSKKLLVILLDISMPVLDGWGFLEALNQIDPHNQIKVFMHSSSLDKNDQEKALKFERVLQYFHKPLNPKKIKLFYSELTQLAID